MAEDGIKVVAAVVRDSAQSTQHAYTLARQ
jgi:hypothetical protein